MDEELQNKLQEVGQVFGSGGDNEGGIQTGGGILDDLLIGIPQKSEEDNGHDEEDNENAGDKEEDDTSETGDTEDDDNKEEDNDEAPKSSAKKSSASSLEGALEQLEKAKQKLSKVEKELSIATKRNVDKDKYITELKEKISKLDETVKILESLEDTESSPQVIDTLQFGYNQLQSTSKVEDFDKASEIIDSNLTDSSYTLVDKINAGNFVMTESLKETNSFVSGVKTWMEDVVIAWERSLKEIDGENNTVEQALEKSKEIHRELLSYLKGIENLPRTSPYVKKAEDARKGLAKAVGVAESKYIPYDEVATGFDTKPVVWEKGVKTDKVLHLGVKQEQAEYRKIIYGAAKKILPNTKDKDINILAESMMKQPELSDRKAVIKQGVKGILNKFNQSLEQKRQMQAQLSAESQKDRELRELREKLERLENPRAENNQKSINSEPVIPKQNNRNQLGGILGDAISY